MPDFKKILDDLIQAVKKLDTTKKMILGGVAAAIVVSLTLVATVSSSDSRVVLFKNLEVSDFAARFGPAGRPYRRR